MSEGENYWYSGRLVGRLRPGMEVCLRAPYASEWRWHVVEVARSAPYGLNGVIGADEVVIISTEGVVVAQLPSMTWVVVRGPAHLCTCGHFGREHDRAGCLVADCPCTKWDYQRPEAKQ